MVKLDGGSFINIISTDLAKNIGLSINTFSKLIIITLENGSSTEEIHFILDVTVGIVIIDVLVSATAIEKCVFEFKLGLSWIAKLPTVTD